MIWRRQRYGMYADGSDRSCTMSKILPKQKTQVSQKRIFRGCATYGLYDAGLQDRDAILRERHQLSTGDCTTADDMTKKHWAKEGGIVAFHAYQSFAPGEVTPELAHEIGMKLAQDLWEDRFEVIVATHLDKAHLYSHFMLNSVSFKDGNKEMDEVVTASDFCYGISQLENTDNNYQDIVKRADEKMYKCKEACK